MPRWLKAEIPRDPNEISLFTDLPKSDDGNFSREDLNAEDAGIPQINVIPSSTPRRSILSNPDFAYETTLISYLEETFKELPAIGRRSSVAECHLTEQKVRRQNRSAIARAFLGDRSSQPSSRDSSRSPTLTSNGVC